MPDVRSVAPFPRPPHRTSVTPAGNCHPVICHEAQPAGIDWLRGVLFLAFVIVATAAIERNERYTAEKIARAEAEQQAAADKRALELANNAPQVRVDLTSPENIRCESFHVRSEWAPAIHQRCIDLGRYILAGRAKD